MPGVTKEQIRQAREADLFAYLERHEHGVLKRDGPNYRHRSMTAWSMFRQKITGTGIAVEKGSMPWTTSWRSADTGLWMRSIY